jgi:hypothetical protein
VNGNVPEAEFKTGRKLLDVHHLDVVTLIILPLALAVTRTTLEIDLPSAVFAVPRKVSTYVGVAEADFACAAERCTTLGLLPETSGNRR